MRSFPEPVRPTELNSSLAGLFSKIVSLQPKLLKKILIETAHRATRHQTRSGVVHHAASGRVTFLQYALSVQLVAT
jgi:hypothetical protein